MFQGTTFIFLKGTVSIISIDLPCKTGKISDFQRYPFMFKYAFLFLCISTARKQQRNDQNIHLLNQEKRLHLPHSLSDNGYLGTVVNQELPSLHGGALEITLTVPFIPVFIR